MRDFTAYCQHIEAAPLDDLISGEHGDVLCDAALDLAMAFSAMPIEQIITACHHDYRLSDRLRQTARKLSLLIEEQAWEQAQEDRLTTRENDEIQRGWDQAGDRLARERAANS